MASLVIGVAGAAVGFFLGGGLQGAYAGFLIGSALGTALFPGKGANGPQKSDLRLQNSSFGQMIPFVYGTDRVAGSVIWQTDLQQVTHKSGGKGSGPQVKTYSYTASFCVRVCASTGLCAVQSVSRVWANKTLIADVNSTDSNLDFGAIPMVVRLGDAAQSPDATMEANLGVGNVPAGRGWCDIVFTDWDLGNYGNAIPSLEFEINTIAQTNSALHITQEVNNLFSASGIWWSTGGYTGSSMVRPKILRWPTGVDPIVVYDYPIPSASGTLIPTTRRFDASTLAFISEGPANTGDGLPAAVLIVWDHGNGSTSNVNFSPIGTWQGVPLWSVMPPFAAHDDAANKFPSLAAVSVIALTNENGQPIPQTPQAGYDIGKLLDVGDYVADAVLTADGNSLFVFAGTWDGSLYTISKWYKLQDFAVADRGTVIPNRKASNYGGDIALGDAHENAKYPQASFENNGLWCWCIGGENGVGTIEVFHIDAAKNFARPTTGSFLWNTAVPGIPPYTVRNGGTPWSSDIGVVYHNTGVALTKVTGAPSAGQYAVDSTGANSFGTYTFNAADATLAVDITFGTPDYILTNDAVVNDGYPPHDHSFPYADIFAFRTGYAGVALGSTLAIISRFPTATTNAPTLAQIFADISGKAGLLPAQIDASQGVDYVDGFKITRQAAARDAIVPLQSAYFFDVVDRAGVVTLVKRGGALAVTIPDNDIAAAPEGSTSPPLGALVRMQEVDLPKTLYVTYVDQDTDYQDGTQYDRRLITQSQVEITASLPVVMTAQHAKSIATTLLYASWLERTKVTFYTSYKYVYLEPTDVVSVHGYMLRIVRKMDAANGTLQFECVLTNSNVWIQGPAAGVQPLPYVPPTPTAVQPSQLLLIDTALVKDDDDPQGVYVALAGANSSAWKGSALFKSSDGGVTFDDVQTTSTPSVMGVASTVLNPWLGGNFFDEMNSVTVVIGNGGGELSSSTNLGVLNGANHAILGDEQFQFRTATLIAANTYTLSGLLRGRRGTEWAVTKHVVGDPFVLFPASFAYDQPLADFKQSRIYRPVSVGATLNSAANVNFATVFRGLECYAPCHVRGGPLKVGSSDDVGIYWTRRTRIGGAWTDYVDVALSEAVGEQYCIQIWNGTFTQCARAFDFQSSQPINYSRAQQITDFGALQSSYFVTVGQRGTFGLGQQQSATIAGTGAVLNDPLVPIQPVQSPPPGYPANIGCPGTINNDTLTGVPQTGYFLGMGPGYVEILTITLPGSIGVGTFILRLGNNSSSDQASTRHVTISAQKCGPPLPVSGAQLSGDPVVMQWYMTGNPDPSRFPTLLQSTTYYIMITQDQPAPLYWSYTVR